MDPALNTWCNTINQLYTLEVRTRQLTERDFYQRRFERIRELLDELHIHVHDPLGEPYEYTRTDCEGIVKRRGRATTLHCGSYQAYYISQITGRSSHLATWHCNHSRKNNMNNTINFGIDLGTTNSAIALYEEGEVTVFKNPRTLKQTLPSVVAFKGDRSVLVGKKPLSSCTKKPAMYLEVLNEGWGAWTGLK